MAPNPNPFWRKQILANLRQTSDHNGGIDIITSYHPDKSWTAYAVGTRKGKRHELLSATGRDPEEALKALHVKSAQDVHQHVEAFGGFGPAHDSDSDSSDSEASTVDDSVLSLSDASDSDNDDRRRKGKSHRRKHKRRTGKPSKRDSSSEDDSDSDDEPVSRRRHTVPARPSYIPTPPITGTQPPPPPPGWRGPPARVFPRGPGGPPPPLPPPGRFQPGMRPGTAVSPPQPQPVPAAPAKPVRLVIRWAGHGEKKIVEHCQPSHRALQRTALAHVRANWQSYENVIAQEMTPGRLWGLGAKVRRVAFGKDMYAISAAAGDDLAMYFKADDIPKFEVDVDHDGSIALPPPPPPPAHAQ